MRNRNDFEIAFFATVCLLRDGVIAGLSGLLIWNAVLPLFMSAKYIKALEILLFDVDESPYATWVGLGIFVMFGLDLFWHLVIKHDVQGWFEDRREAKLEQQAAQREELERQRAAQQREQERQANLDRELEAKQAYLVQGARTYVTENGIALIRSEDVDAFRDMMHVSGAKYYPTAVWQREVRYQVSDEQRYARNVQFLCLEWMRAQMAVVQGVYSINHGDHLEIREESLRDHL
jgi:hypothetical protein